MGSLMETCINLMQAQFVSFVSSDLFIRLPAETVLTLLRNDNLSVDSEEAVFAAISSWATTIFAADEDIQEGQLIVFLLLHRKLNVREDGVELFFERQHLIPFGDDEGVIHIPSPTFRRMASISDLETFTAKLSDKDFRQQMLSHLGGFGGQTLAAFVDRVFSALFEDAITHHLTFYGRQQGKSAFFGSPVYALVLDVFNRWNADHNSDRQELEKCFRLMFRRAYDRLQKRTSKQSSSRPLEDTADDEQTPRPGPSGSSSQP
ncbi:hypothetical protein SprV_1002857400 [Sparganum proliferum]